MPDSFTRQTPHHLELMHLSMLSCWGAVEAGHRWGIWTQISFSVQMPGPREVTLGQKSANSSLQGHYCWSKKTQQMIKSPYHGQSCNIKSPSYARPPPPSSLILIGALNMLIITPHLFIVVYSPSPSHKNRHGNIKSAVTKDLYVFNVVPTLNSQW